MRSLAMVLQSSMCSLSAKLCCAGEPWCPDCTRCLEPARARVAEAGGTLLEVQVRLSDVDYPLDNMPVYTHVGFASLHQPGS